MAYEWQLLIGHRVNMTGYRHPKSGLSAQCTQGYDVDSLFSLVSVLARARQLGGDIEVAIKQLANERREN